MSESSVGNARVQFLKMCNNKNDYGDLYVVLQCPFHTGNPGCPVQYVACMFWGDIHAAQIATPTSTDPIEVPMLLRAVNNDVKKFKGDTNQQACPIPPCSSHGFAPTSRS